MDDTDRALKFGLVLDSLCAGVSAMPQDAARSGGLRPEPISVVSALRAPAAIADWASCSIGSCHRHEECMYHPCRNGGDT